MDETEREQQYGEDDESDEEDDSYANAYLNDDGDNEDDDDEDDLAEMFAKVKTIQQSEGIQPSVQNQSKANTKTSSTPATLDVKILQATTATPRGSSAGGRVSNGSTPTSSSSMGRKSRSPSSAATGGGGGVMISEDGIKTISRRSMGSTGAARGPAVRVDALLNVKKPAIYEDKLLQSVKSSDLLEKLKMKTVQVAPVLLLHENQFRLATIAKRIETLSEPAKKSTGRKFATDDEECHCRFKPKKSGGAQKSASDYDNDDTGGGGNDKRNDFIARMEAAEKSKQKRLEMTRGENDYNARLDKKCCPKCTMPQSYSEYKGKKKRCQMCGVEFRVLQAWGDVGQDFIARMSEATQAKAEKQHQIRAQVIQQETNAMKVQKTAKQQFYEKQMIQKNSQHSFLDRNYQSNASSKTKQTQLQIQMQIQSQRAKLLAATCEPPVI